MIDENIEKIVIYTSSRDNSDDFKIDTFTVTNLLQKRRYRDKSFYEDILPRREYVISKKDVIYIYPSSTIPRFKMKSFCEEFDVKITKNPDKANIKILSRATIEDKIEEEYLYKVGDKEKFMDIARKHVAGFDSDGSIKALLKDKDLYIDSSSVHYICTHVTAKFEQVSFNSDNRRGYIPVSVIDDEALALFKSFDSKFYWEESLLEKLNMGAVMNNKQYEDIQRLLSSCDDSDKKLAVEIMANCDFKKSCVYLLLLIKDYGSVIYYLNSSNHVNFKSLLKFFNIKRDTLIRCNINTVIDILIQKRLLNAVNFQELEPYIIEDIESDINEGYMKPETFVPIDDIYKAIDENILEPCRNTTVEEFNNEQINPHL